MNTTLPANITSWTDHLVSNLLPYIGQLLLSAIGWIVLFTFIGGIIGLVLVWKIGRAQLLRRHHWLWNVCAKVSYVVILLGMPLTGAALGMVYGAHRQIQPVLEQEVRPVLASGVGSLRTYLALQLKGYQPGQLVSLKSLLDPLFASLTYKPQSNSYWERKKAHLINRVVVQQGAEVMLSSLQYVLAEQIEAAGRALTDGQIRHEDSAQLAQLSVETLLKFTRDEGKGTDFGKLDRSLPGIMLSAIEGKINHYFNSLYGSIGLTFLLVALLIGAEILIYRHYFWPGLVPATAAQPR